MLLGARIFNCDSAENNYGCFIFTRLWFISKDNSSSVIEQTECEIAAPEPVESRVGGNVSSVADMMALRK